jgi:23S rRNA (adenine2503-C2)-methyltransferase
MTLRESAAFCGGHPRAVRDAYARMMREGTGASLSRPARVQCGDGVTKFCLPAGSVGGAALESESVIIPMNSYRGSAWYTLCVSSQVGCRMGCTFCETGSMGLLRNLSAGEMVRQRMVARELMRASVPEQRGRGVFRYFGDGIQNVVFMGMGEPLDNLDDVLQAIRVLNEPTGLDFPLAQITVSTVGRIDGLRRLGALVRAADRERDWSNLRLAVSLNAADDELRDHLMPINKGMPLAALQRALLDYPLPRKGLFLIEYVLIKGVNDSLHDADRVAAWCRPLRCVVNLIPYNPQRAATYETPDEEAVVGFLLRLRSHGIFVKRRVTQGRDVMGACGQLGNRALRHAATRQHPVVHAEHAQSRGLR